MNKDVRILGIDPGTRFVGFALIVADGSRGYHPNHFNVEDLGLLKADCNLSTFERVGYLHDAMTKIVTVNVPSICVIEGAFFGFNPQSALKLGLARGALASACFRCGIKVSEISPAKVKKSITGKGGATKTEVASSLEHLMKGLKVRSLPLDVSDALAVAFSFMMLHGHQLFDKKLPSQCASLL